LLKKKVRYTAGAVGAIPVLAMVPLQAGVPASHAGHPASSTGKTVRTTFAYDVASVQPSSSSPSDSGDGTFSCKGSVGNHHTVNDMTIRFYSKPAGSRTCIGTIQASSGAAIGVGLWVSNNFGGQFCEFSAHNSKVSHRCRRVFRRDKLEVEGNANTIFGSNQAISTYPFRHNGFR
jgi:hypothetical protein